MVEIEIEFNGSGKDIWWINREKNLMEFVCTLPRNASMREVNRAVDEYIKKEVGQL